MDLRLVVAPLTGHHVRLEPLAIAHVPGLLRAANEDRSSYGLTSVPENAEAMTRYVEELRREHDAGECTPFAQVDVRTHQVVGATRFLNIRLNDGAEGPWAVEIGGTWLGASAQRTAVNTEAKYLLLSHAFETWRVVRVDLKTDARNERSRRAIERIGARFEGVLRQWQPSMVSGEEGLYRDSALYSVVGEEWPSVRVALVATMARSARAR